MTSRISVKTLQSDYGIKTNDQWLSQLGTWMHAGVVPALCEDGCEVEPDGCCEHGHPSVLLVAGVI